MLRLRLIYRRHTIFARLMPSSFRVRFFSRYALLRRRALFSHVMLDAMQERDATRCHITMPPRKSVPGWHVMRKRA